jgi:16S rRNA (adenine1518-N6/adenine1519-N6)-dimethyltransferase
MYYKKKLSQNFLIDKNIVKKIIESCELKKADSILEIGAGRGELTVDLAKRVKRVIAVELDRRLCEILKERLKDLDNVEIVCEDILRYKIPKGKLKVVSNLPYAIATPIIEYLIENRSKISKIFISLQKELAYRLIATPGNKDYGSLSLFVQYYTEPKILFPIKRRSFWPPPKVDSVFLRLNLRKGYFPFVKDESLLFKIIRKVFSARRKMLRNSLEYLFPKDRIACIFEELRLNPFIRPEELSLEDFCRIANLLSSA